MFQTIFCRMKLKDEIKELADAVGNLAHEICEWERTNRQHLLILERIALAETRLSVLIKKSGSSKRVRFDWAIEIVETKPQTNIPMEIKITNEQQVRVTLTPKTDTGRPAKLDGAPTWSIVDGSSTITVAEDGLSALLVSADDPGDTNILVKADADIGEGIEEISDIIKLSVVGATAKNLGISAGAPETKPVA